MKKVIVVCGPTAVGKSELAIALAQEFNGEIINADSMQVYKGMNIGTAKVIDQQNIPHHLMDIKELNQTYSVFEYQKDARRVIEKLLKADKTPIIVGGTGLYIKATVYDYHFQNNVNVNLDWLSNKDLKQLVDKKYESHDIHINNRKRLESALKNNKHFDSNKLIYDTIFIGLTMGREQLYERINYRVNQMISAGLVDEVNDLYRRYQSSKALQTAIGYKEIINNDDSEKIKQNSRNYAKRQYTWFNNQMDVKWFDVTIPGYKENIIAYIKKHN